MTATLILNTRYLYLMLKVSTL